MICVPPLLISAVIISFTLCPSSLSASGSCAVFEDDRRRDDANGEYFRKLRSATPRQFNNDADSLRCE